MQLTSYEKISIVLVVGVILTRPIPYPHSVCLSHFWLSISLLTPMFKVYVNALLGAEETGHGVWGWGGVWGLGWSMRMGVGCEDGGGVWEWGDKDRRKPRGLLANDSSQSASSMFNETAFKEIRQRVTKEDTWHQPLIPVHTYMPSPFPTPNKSFNKP